MKPFSTRSGDKPIPTPVTPAEIQMEADVQRACDNASGISPIAVPQMAPTPTPPPSTRQQCGSAMETQHAYIDALKAQLVTAQADLDGLIRLNNSLPVEHVKRA